MLISCIFWKLSVATLFWLRLYLGASQYSFKFSDRCLELVPHLHDMAKTCPAP